MLKRSHFEQSCLIDKTSFVTTDSQRNLKHIQLCIVRIVPADDLAPSGGKTLVFTIIAILGPVYLQHWNVINKREIKIFIQQVKHIIWGEMKWYNSDTNTKIFGNAEVRELYSKCDVFMSYLILSIQKRILQYLPTGDMGKIITIHKFCIL